MDGIRVSTDIHGRPQVAFWCRACGHIHHVYIDGKNPAGKNWTWDPTTQSLSPSVRHFYHDCDADGKMTGAEVTTCHYIVAAGHMNYCGDCKHSLANQSVPLNIPPPSNYGGKESFGWT